MRWEPFWMPAIVAASLAIGMTGHAQEPSAAPGGALDRVAVFKQSLQQGLGAVRRYLDPATNRLVALGVNSYLDTQEDVVALEVQMNTLPDGALYAAQTTLDAKARNIRVVMQNAGHQPLP